METSRQIGPVVARELRSAVRTAGRRSGLGAAALDRAELAVWEAVANAVEHGQAPVQVAATGGEAELIVYVWDAGPGPGSRLGLDDRSAPTDDQPADPRPTGDRREDRGRGLALIRASVDGFAARVAETGWRVELRIIDRDEVPE